MSSFFFPLTYASCKTTLIYRKKQVVFLYFFKKFYSFICMFINYFRLICPYNANIHYFAFECITLTAYFVEILFAKLNYLTTIIENSIEHLCVFLFWIIVFCSTDLCVYASSNLIIVVSLK